METERSDSKSPDCKTSFALFTIVYISVISLTGLTRLTEILVDRLLLFQIHGNYYEQSFTLEFVHNKGRILILPQI